MLLESPHASPVEPWCLGPASHMDVISSQGQGLGEQGGVEGLSDREEFICCLAQDLVDWFFALL